MERVGLLGVRIEKARCDEGRRVLGVVSCGSEVDMLGWVYCGIERLSGEIVDLERRGADALVVERRHCILNMANRW